jgi:hypothetical protein
MAKIENIQLGRRDVWTKLDKYSYDLEEVQAVAEYKATWIGKPVYFRVECNRHSWINSEREHVLTDWNGGYIRHGDYNSHYIVEGAFQNRGNELTDTAKSALVKAVTPELIEKLKAYDLGRSIARNIQHLPEGKHSYGAEAVHKAVEKWRDVIGETFAELLTSYAVTLDEANKCLEELTKYQEETRPTVEEVCY